MMVAKPEILPSQMKNIEIVLLQLDSFHCQDLLYTQMIRTYQVHMSTQKRLEA